MKQHLKQAHDGHPKNSANRKARSLPEDELPPSTLLINPFRGLSDPADMEGKISSIKESGSRCWKVACVILPENVPKKKTRMGECAYVRQSAAPALIMRLLHGEKNYEEF